MLDLSVLDEIIPKDNTKPSNIEFIYYLFWGKGIDYNAFNNLPIPYILSITKSYNWVKKEEEIAYEKARKKK
jgi:hypothetical protein